MDAVDCGKFGLVGPAEYEQLLVSRRDMVQELLDSNPADTGEGLQFNPYINRQTDTSIDESTRIQNAIDAMEAFLDGNYKRTYLLAMQSDLDDPDVCNTIGLLFINGYYVQKSHLEAFFWFLRGYLNDGSAASHSLAKMYEECQVSDEMEKLCGVGALLPPVLFFRIAPPNADFNAILPDLESKDKYLPDGTYAYAAEDDFIVCSTQKAAFYRMAAIALAEDASEAWHQIDNCKKEAKFSLSPYLFYAPIAVVCKYGLGAFDKNPELARANEDVVPPDKRGILDYLYGMALHSGIGIKADRAAALEYFQSAAFKNVQMAQRFARYLSTQGFRIYATRKEALADGFDEKLERVAKRTIDSLAAGNRKEEDDDPADDEPLGFWGWVGTIIAWICALAYFAFILAKFAILGLALWLAWNIASEVAKFFLGGFF